MDKVVLKLYIAGQTTRSERAVANLRQVRAQCGWDFDLVIIDVLEHPELAEEDRILAVPTLVKEAPPPNRRVIGDLSDHSLLLKELNLNARQSEETVS